MTRQAQLVQAVEELEAAPKARYSKYPAYKTTGFGATP